MFVPWQVLLNKYLIFIYLHTKIVGLLIMTTLPIVAIKTIHAHADLSSKLIWHLDDVCTCIRDNHVGHSSGVTGILFLGVYVEGHLP